MDSAASAAPGSAGAKQQQPPATTAQPPAEDERGDDGASMDTFSAYQPTALSAAIIAECNKSSAVTASGSSDDAIMIYDDDKDETNDTSTASMTTTNSTVKLTVSSHRCPACESNLLASVHAPLLINDADTAATILPLLQSGALSPLQAEGVLLAIQRHRRLFTTNGTTISTRAGFFLGDGAGIGKGRQIAAVIRDAACRQDTTRRHLWLSVSRDLIQDARRDMGDVGLHNLDVHDGTQLLDNTAGLGASDKGVLFLTYSLLVSRQRLEHLVQWCAGTRMVKQQQEKLEAEFDGCIVLDEAHKAKNLAANTKTAKLVIELQRRLPKARVVYGSATGVSSIAHLAYAERLGLWGTAGSSFTTFSEFCKSLESRGLAALELLALELKLQGSFLARTLSWEGTTFDTTQLVLDCSQQEVYNAAVMWWTQCKCDLEWASVILAALPPPTTTTRTPTMAIGGDTGSNDNDNSTTTTTNNNNNGGNMVWRNFWSAHQRFFKELAICAKIPWVAQDALRRVHEEHKCVVIGLQSTGEAGMQRLLLDGDADSTYPTLLSTLQAILIQFVQTHFPVGPQQQQAAPTITEKSPPPQQPASVPPIPELVEMRQRLLDAIPTLNLPPNPLDDLIDRLGGVDKVAEMTGRSGRMVRNRNKNEFVYAKRGGNGNSSKDDASERTNQMERQQFMDGKKFFAIISDAASTGISLHAAVGSGASDRRRVHYTIELPWSADKAVQQLGRSHRSGQTSAPQYQLVVTNLGGERRFAAAVSKRMASLGALTKGDRRAATGSNLLADFDLDSRYGKRALKRFYSALAENDFYVHFARSLQQPDGGFSAAVGDHVLPPQCLPCRNAKELLDHFADEERTRLNGSDLDILPGLPTSNAEAQKHATILDMASQALELVGLDREGRTKADVRVFLNRLAGLPVSRQTLVFSLFMGTFADVIHEAKSTGEFEGTAEDIKATSIVLDAHEDLAIDPASGAPTKLTSLVLDRGISFETVCTMAMEEARKTTKNSKSYEGDNKDADNDDDDGWMSNASDRVALAGFYISRNRIAGRNLILFAKRKFDRFLFPSNKEADAFDPQGWMIISRPNTGTNLTDMSSSDLHNKYHLAASCERLSEFLSSQSSSLDGSVVPALELAVEQEFPNVANVWMQAFRESNHFTHHEGLAPRRAKVALITGPVLHVMPALEKVVRFRSDKDRALKIMRAQVDGGQRFVGVRFPSDPETLASLLEELAKLQNARTSAGTAFTDETLAPVCSKRMEWSTAERKTMKSFFQVTSSSSKMTVTKSTSMDSKMQRNSTSSGACFGKNGTTGKRGAPASSTLSSSSSASSGKKAKTSSIKSFFVPSRKN